MNIFVLDKDPKLAAQYHNDKHCSKMCLESAQIIASAIHRLDGIHDKNKVLPKTKEGNPYGKGYINHPCSKWAASSLGNFQWLWDLLYELGKEFSYRYGKLHSSAESVRINTPRELKADWPEKELTNFVNCTTHKDIDDIVEAYRLYYRVEKIHLAEWSKRKPPWWFKEETMGDRFYAQQKEATGGVYDPSKPVKDKRTKKDISIDLQKRLETNIDFSKLNKDDLLKLEKLL